VRKIKYKEKITDQYHTYIDIGACEKYYDFLPLYDDEVITYNNWYLDFIKYPLGVQMLTLHYYLLKFNSDGFMPETLNKKIIENIDILNRFNKTWFEEDAPFFKGLDLNWEGINNDIAEKIENKEGVISEVYFKDGSSICFLNEDDTIQSFYVKEIEYEKLKTEFDTILEILK
jgi:hypothetical protein